MHSATCIAGATESWCDHIIDLVCYRAQLCGDVHDCSVVSGPSRSLTTRTEPSGRPPPALAPAGDPPAAGHASMCASLPALLQAYRSQLLPLLDGIADVGSKPSRR